MFVDLPMNRVPPWDCARTKFNAFHFAFPPVFLGTRYSFNSLYYCSGYCFTRTRCIVKIPIWTRSIEEEETKKKKGRGKPYRAELCSWLRIKLRKENGRKKLTLEWLGRKQGRRQKEKRTSGKENVKEYGKLDRKRAESCASRDDLVKKKKKGNVFGWRAQAYQREAAK